MQAESKNGLFVIGQIRPARVSSSLPRPASKCRGWSSSTGWRPWIAGETPPRKSDLSLQSCPSGWRWRDPGLGYCMTLVGWSPPRPLRPTRTTRPLSSSSLSWGSTAQPWPTWWAQWWPACPRAGRDCSAVPKQLFARSPRAAQPLTGAAVGTALWAWFLTVSQCTRREHRTRIWCRQWPRPLQGKGRHCLCHFKFWHYRTFLPIAVRPSALGELVWIVLKMLMSTRNIVTSRVMRPGITSGLTRKLIHDTTTKRPDGK